MTTNTTPHTPARPFGDEEFFMISTLADGTEIVVDRNGDTAPILSRVSAGTQGQTKLIEVDVDGTPFLVNKKRIIDALCSSCQGTGYRRGYEYSDGGRCWPCGYSGVYSGDVRRYKAPSFRTLRRSIAREAAKAATYAAQAAEDARIAAERKAAFRAANPELVAAAQEIMDWRDADGDRMCTEYQFHLADEILSGMPGPKAIERFRVVVDEVAAKRAELAARIPVPTGKVEIVGELVSFKSNQWGLKMLVVDDRGFKVFGTFPVALDAADKGSRVAFVADCTPSDRDEFFGFFSRPSKCRVL